MNTTNEKIKQLIAKIKDNKHQIIHLMRINRSTSIQNAMNFVSQQLTIEAAILFPEKLPRTQKALNMDYNNLANLSTAWIQILNSPHNIVIDSYQIRDMHKLLCRDTENTQGGIYRISNTFAMRRQSPDYNKLLYKMNDIEYKLSPQYMKNNSPIITALDVHSDMVEAQPFTDYNKRTARMIMNWVLFKNYYSPILFNYPSDGKLYMENLRASLDDNKQVYYEYMLMCMVRTQRDIIALLCRPRNM